MYFCYSYCCEKSVSNMPTELCVSCAAFTLGASTELRLMLIVHYFSGCASISGTATTGRCLHCIVARSPTTRSCAKCSIVYWNLLLKKVQTAKNVTTTPADVPPFLTNACQQCVFLSSICHVEAHKLLRGYCTLYIECSSICTLCCVSPLHSFACVQQYCHTWHRSHSALGQRTICMIMRLECLHAVTRLKLCMNRLHESKPIVVKLIAVLAASAR
jgi:hypothetical protein